MQGPLRISSRTYSSGDEKWWTYEPRFSELRTFRVASKQSANSLVVHSDADGTTRADLDSHAQKDRLQTDICGEYVT